nr:lectin-like protein [uncultured Mediterranean phage uvMED]
MASTVLRKDYSGSGNRQRQTISVWVKKTSNGGNSVIFSVRHTGNSNYYGFLRFKTDDSLQYFTNTPSVNIRTNRLFRDVNAWYHIVISTDTTQGTEADRVKMYVNGVQETSLNTATYPSQNGEVTFGDNYRHEIGSYDGSNFFDGCLSHFHFITNTTYQASTFGSTDSVTGEWQINTSPSVTYATNSFFLLKDGNSVTDQSGQSNNYTVAGGTLTKTEDNPSNVFATMNPLNVPTSNAPTFSNGNTTTVSSTSGSGKWGGSTTLGMTSGKFYCEAKATVDSQYTRNVLGITGDSMNMARGNGSPLGSDQTSSGWYSENGQVNWNNSAQYTASTYTTGDILSIAIDLDNNRLFYAKNGVWQNSGNPTTSTGAITISSADNTNDGAYFVCQADDTGTSATSKFEFNFGNGYFGTTAVASAGSNASGNGIFEYDVPSGYTALSTKGLNL